MQLKNKNKKDESGKTNTISSFDLFDFNLIDDDSYFDINVSDFEEISYSDDFQNMLIPKNDKKNESISNNFESSKRTKKIVEKIELTKNGKNFRDIFDFHLNDRHKKISKKKVIIMYNKVYEKLNLPAMTREEKRSINKFFNHYGNRGVEIVKAIKESIKKE